MTAPGPSRAWTSRTGGVTLTVRLTPRAARDDLAGCERRDDGREALRARVRAAPEDGRANAALVRLLADALDVAASAVTLVAGATGRTKTLAIAGDPQALSARLAALADTPPTGARR
ncbi:MAG: DUF167 domain-containing protein [Methylobacteriaceae bacterium]|nr:DUF167 domain-containing protein [Methylobacteriaceae bacterium]